MSDQTVPDALPSPELLTNYILSIRDLTISYPAKNKVVIRGATLEIPRGKVTALIGPSGCGKTTFLRSLNRFTDLPPPAKVTGEITFNGQTVYGAGMRINELVLRAEMGMVLQTPTPFPKSIFDNVAFGPRLQGVNNKRALEELVEESLRKVALWDELRSDLDRRATKLSGGQQQRLCIARCLALRPAVLLMDESTSSLDPIAIAAVEKTIRELSENGVTIVIVTHNMQQAKRIADFVAFLNIRQDATKKGDPTWGEIVEQGPKDKIFSRPEQQETADYIMGKLSFKDSQRRI
mgnify:CR=1 FL=1